MEPIQLLIVEDDEALAELLAEYLTKNGFACEIVGRGDTAVDRILALAPKLVILDLMLPGLDGVEVCRRVRSRFAGAILMLTARKDDVDEVVGLEMGADDYVTKPVYPRVLLARVRSLLRRLDPHPLEPSSRRTVGPLTIDRSKRDAQLDERPLKLTSIEFDLLWALAEQPGQVIGRERLYRDVLGSEWDGLDRGVDIHVSRIRQKLVGFGLDASAIKSVRGAGYVLALG